MPQLKVLLVGSECAPFSKTGGLGDVMGALPKALERRGIEARVVMPLYAGIPWNDLERLEGELVVPTGLGEMRCGVRMGKLPKSNVTIYFLEHHHYFDRPYLYGPPGEAYPDNLDRFTFLSRGALALCNALGFVPDVVHANDWQTALVPVYLNTVEWGTPLHGSASVYTIHNLAYQGVFDRNGLFVTGLGREHYHPREFEHFGAMNLTKAALYHSTLLTTVSPTYAREIQTPEHGFGLDGVLSERSRDLSGVLNGIDTEEWSPETDPFIPARFSARELSGKALCKRALQAEAGFPILPDVPLFGVVGRLTSQKGFDVLAQILCGVLDLDVQIVLLGSGDAEAERFFAHAATVRPDRFRAFIGFDNARAHRIEAGSDFFLMPSRFEPCGLNQLYSLRYGTLPIVRATGGLVDTVWQYDERTGGGTGFVLATLRRLPSTTLSDGPSLRGTNAGPTSRSMRREAMRQDFPLDRSAEAYEAIYRAAYGRRRGHPFPG